MTHAGGSSCDCAECVVHAPVIAVRGHGDVEWSTASALADIAAEMLEGVRVRVEGRDDGAARDTRPEKPCSARMAHGGWCLLLAHPPEVQHVGLPTETPLTSPDFGPGRKR